MKFDILIIVALVLLSWLFLGLTFWTSMHDIKPKFPNVITEQPNIGTSTK